MMTVVRNERRRELNSVFKLIARGIFMRVSCLVADCDVEHEEWLS
jgi:hypothetical protein